MSSLPRLDNRLTSPSYAPANSFTQPNSTEPVVAHLNERVRRLETRMSIMERRRSPSGNSLGENPRGKPHLPRMMENIIGVCGSGLDVNPGSMLTARHVLMNLTERFDAQLSTLEMRVSRLENSTSQPAEERSATKLLNNEVRIVKATITALEFEVSQMSRKIDERYNRLTVDVDASTARLRGELDGKLAGISEKLSKPVEKTSPGTTYDPANSTENLDQKWTKVIEDRNKCMLDGLQARIDEHLKILYVRLQKLEDAHNELRAKLDMEHFGFRKLCSEVAQDVSSKLLQPEVQKLPKPWQADQLMRRSADGASNANHSLLLERLNALKYKMKAEMNLLKSQYQDDVQRLSNQCREMEDKLASFSKQNSEQKLELEGVISAEIKSRRAHETTMQNQIKRVEDKLTDVSGALRNSLLELQLSLGNTRPPRSESKTGAPSTKSDPQLHAIKDIYRRLEELNELSKRQYSELHKEVRAETDRLYQVRDNLNKDLDAKSTELKRQFNILHSEVVNLQVRIPKQQYDEPVTDEQNSEIRKVAESLFAVKMTLAMKIRLLEKKEKSEHERIQTELEKLKTLVKPLLPE